MKKIFVFIIIELITIDCFCLTPWRAVENPTEPSKTVEEIYNNIEKDITKRIESSSELANTINSLNPEELKEFRSRVFNHYLNLPENQLIISPTKTRKVEFSEIESLVFKQNATSTVKKNFLAEPSKSADEFLAGLKAEFEPARNTTSQSSKGLSNSVANNNLFPLIVILFLLFFLTLGLAKLKCLKPIAKFYSIQGRASRKTYWIWWFAMLPLFGLFSIFFFFLADIIFFLQSKNLSPYWGIVPLWILFLAYIPYICIQIRRLHDMNLSGNWFFLALVVNHTPLVVVKWLILGCVPGTKTANKFGEPTISNPKNASKIMMSSKLKEGIETLFTSAETQNKPPMRNKKQILISFLVGLIVGAASVYALSNRYVSYPSFKWNIVRIDRLTGKTEIASARDPSAGWTEVKEK